MLNTNQGTSTLMQVQMGSPVTSSDHLYQSTHFIPDAPIHRMWERHSTIVFIGGFPGDSDAEPGLDTALPGSPGH